MLDYAAQQEQEFNLWLESTALAREKFNISVRSPEEQQRQQLKSQAVWTPKHNFRTFAQSAFKRTLDLWQVDFCNRLQDVYCSSGQRKVLVHCPPQFGKTVILSQRFPAWCIGENPDVRIKSVMYNISHAIKKGGLIVRSIMQSRVFRNYYPSPDSFLPVTTKAGEWSVALRAAAADGQPSFMSLGLQTGLVGEGMDLCTIDDPYPGTQEITSEAYNESLHTFWTDGVVPRMTESTKVVVLFHRYDYNDFAGWLLKEEPGEWEVWLYQAQAGEPYHDDHADRFIDPLPKGRKPGEYLTKRHAPEFFEQKKKNTRVWLSQFQGTPPREKGQFFDTSQIKIIGFIPDYLNHCRAWDFAGGELKSETDMEKEKARAGKRGAASASGRIAGPDDEGRYIICHATEDWLETEKRMRLVRQRAELDGRGVTVALPRDPGSAGKDVSRIQVKQLAGFSTRVMPTNVDKEQRAQPFADQVNIGNVLMLKDTEADPWNAIVLKRLHDFPLANLKDVVDALSDAFAVVALKPRRKKKKKVSSTSSIFD